MKSKRVLFIFIFLLSCASSEKETKVDSGSIQKQYVFSNNPYKHDSEAPFSNESIAFLKNQPNFSSKNSYASWINECAKTRKLPELKEVLKKQRVQLCFCSSPPLPYPNLRCKAIR